MIDKIMNLLGFTGLVAFLILDATLAMVMFGWDTT